VLLLLPGPRRPVGRVAAGVRAVAPAVPAPRWVPGTSPSLTQPAGLSAGLIGHWAFDERPGSGVAIDRSPSANDCTVHGPGVQIAGRHGGALHLGGESWLECPRPEALARLDQELTVAAWVRPASRWGAQTIAARSHEGSRPDQFFFGLVNGQLDVTSRTWRKRLDVALPAAPGSWIHVAFTRSADGTVALYAGGKLLRAITGRRLGISAGTGPLTIGGGLNGARDGTADELFAGDLDDLVIYARALPPPELAALAAGARPD